MSLFSPAASAQEATPFVSPEPGQVLATAVHPFDDPEPRRTEDRVPLLEVFTATWCPPCAPADRALERIMDDMSPGLAKGPGENGSTDGDRIDLALLAYHPFPDPEGLDPFGIPEGHARMRAKYDAFWFPTVLVDGHLEDGPTTRSIDVQAGIEEVHHQSYRGLIEQARAVPPVFTLETDWVQDGGNLTVSVHVEAVAHAEGPFLVRGAFWEDHLHHRGQNGIEDHRMTVRAMTGTQVVPRLAPGEETTLTWDLRIPANIAFDGSGITFFVETPMPDEETVTPAMIMTYAIGIGVAAVLLVFGLRRYERQARRAKDRRRRSPPPAPVAEGRPGPEGP